MFFSFFSVLFFLYNLGGKSFKFGLVLSGGASFGPVGAGHWLQVQGWLDPPCVNTLFVRLDGLELLPILATLKLGG